MVVQKNRQSRWSSFSQIFFVERRNSFLGIQHHVMEPPIISKRECFSASAEAGISMNAYGMISQTVSRYPPPVTGLCRCIMESR